MINASARSAVLRFPHDPHLLIDDPDAPDAVVLLGLDLYHLLKVVGDCAEDMRRHAEGGVPAGKQFRALTAACDRATTIAQRLTSTEMLSWRDRYPIDIKLVVLDCADMLECALGSRILLEHHLTANHYYVAAERIEIDRILLNLALAGRAAMPEGGVLTIELAALKQVPPGLRPPHVRARTYVRLVVEDSGAGMPSTTRLIALAPGALRKLEGTALALAAVAHTVRALEGRLNIESDGGRGTRVIIDLPCVE